MKKYALNNSYFKNRKPNDPDTLTEVVSYLVSNGELPFRYDGDNWSYDVVCERQKRYGVTRCQYLTPDKTAEVIAKLTRQYCNGTELVLEPACGTGQITKELIKQGFVVSAFDIDPEMIAIHNYLYESVYASAQDFLKIKDAYRWQLIVSNPPFDKQIAQEFISWIVENLAKNGRAILLLPKDYVDKTSPKTVVECLAKLKILYRTAVQQRFAHTPTRCEIVVLEKID